MIHYSHLFFDCDGVVLNSNHIKTRTFYDVAFKYGEEKAQELVKYHITNGGVSRYKKFEFFLKEILKNFEEKEYINLLNEYGNLLKKKLINAEVADGIYNVKNLFPNALNAIISGSDENELKQIFDKKKYRIFSIMEYLEAQKINLKYLIRFIQVLKAMKELYFLAIANMII